MFTGLIETVMPVVSSTKTATGLRLCIELGELADDAKFGDSICVNGTCLTISSLKGKRADFDVMPETLAVSTIKNLKTSTLVNLERAMPADGRFGGHIVQGHIDGIGTIEKIEADKNQHVIWIGAEAKLIDQLITKGSIAIDGISLTVVELKGNSFSVSLIPTSLEETNIAGRKVGDKVNLEADLIGKWINKRIDQVLAAKKPGSNLTIENLRKQGFV